MLGRLAKVKTSPVIPASILAYVLGSETHVNAADESRLANESEGVERTRAALLEIPPQLTTLDGAALL